MSTYLRPFTMGDVPALHETLGRGDVMTHYVDLADHTTGWAYDATERFVKEAVDATPFTRWAVCVGSRDDVVGYCGFDWLTWLPGVWPNPAVELSYFLHPQVWGRGVAGAASRLALARLAVAYAGVPVACCTPGNTGSQRVMAKLGFTLESEWPYESPSSGVSTTFLVHRAPAGWADGVVA